MPRRALPLDQLQPSARYRRGVRDDPEATRVHAEQSHAWRRARADAAFDADRRAAFLLALGESGSLRQAAAVAGISPNRVWGRARRDPGFAEELEQLLADCCPAPAPDCGTIRGYRAGGRCSSCRAAKHADRGLRPAARPVPGAGARTGRRRARDAGARTALEGEIDGPPIAGRLDFGAPDGHGRYGLLDRDEEGRLLCHECGKWLRHLGTHLRMHELTAPDYRARHGLSTGTGLVSDEIAGKLRVSSSRAPQLERLAQHRDPDRARAGMTADAQHAPELIAGRRARARARQVVLTAEQITRLGAFDDVAEWTRRARALIDHDEVPVAAIARALGVPRATVYARLARAAQD